jgi:hypothetical protein
MDLRNHRDIRVGPADNGRCIEYRSSAVVEDSVRYPFTKSEEHAFRSVAPRLDRRDNPARIPSREFGAMTGCHDEVSGHAGR